MESAEKARDGRCEAERGGGSWSKYPVSPQDSEWTRHLARPKDPPGGAGRVRQGLWSLRGARAPAPADAEASEKGALITSEVCFAVCRWGSADEKHILGQDQSDGKIDYVCWGCAHLESCCRDGSLGQKKCHLWVLLRSPAQRWLKGFGYQTIGLTEGLEMEMKRSVCLHSNCFVILLIRKFQSKIRALCVGVFFYYPNLLSQKRTKRCDSQR